MARRNPAKFRSTLNLPLKLAIVGTRRTQKRIATAARMTENRLSQIVHGVALPPSSLEKSRLAKVLGQPITILFPDNTAAA
jgi:hypothetical protein